MSDIRAAFAAVIDAWIADPALTRADAGAVVEGFGPTMTGGNARQWLDAVAVLYESLGVINNATYSSMRNSAIADGDVKAKALFDALFVPVGELLETEPVADAILIQSNIDGLATIDSNILLLQGFKTGGVNQQLDDALQDGVRYLRKLERSLQ